MAIKYTKGSSKQLHFFCKTCIEIPPFKINASSNISYLAIIYNNS